MRSIKLPKLPKLFEKANFWLIAIGILIVVAVIYIGLSFFKKAEKFRDYAIPAGADGTVALAELGISAKAINDVTNLTIKSQDDNPLKHVISACEKVKGWNCESISNPEFAANCGICTKDGVNSLGEKHEGGMYLDPNIMVDALEQFKTNGTIPTVKPSIGTCKGEFLITRPHCDTQKDRDYCAQQTIMTPAVLSKCGQCVTSEDPTFVYMGKRGGASTNFALIPKTGTSPYSFKIRLKVIVSSAKECTIYMRDPINPGNIDPLTKQPKEKIYPGAFAPSSTIYICDLSGVTENQPFELVVKWPEYHDHVYTAEEKTRVQNLVNPVRAPLTRATYGPWTGNYKKDDPRAVDVTSYVKNRFKNAAECADPVIKISNDGCGGDPTPGIVKQLRLAYSFDGNVYTYAFGKEGEETKVEDSGEEGQNFKKLCPPVTKQEDADEKVCTQDAYKTPITNRSYSGDCGTQIQKKYKFWGSTGTTPCVITAQRPGRGIVGIWESLGRAPRRVLFEQSITLMNNVIPSTTANKLGTMLTNVFNIDNKISASINIPNHAKWLWPGADADSGQVPQIGVFKCVIPATLKDTSKLADTPLCSGGAIVTTMEGATRLQADPCSKPVMGKPQAPGTYTEACIKSTFLANGCKRKGAAFPGTPQTRANLAGKGRGNDVATMASAVKNMFLIATTGKDSTGKAVSAKEKVSAIENCLGDYVADPCDTPTFTTGPQTIECLDYLWRNMGRNNQKIGPTYPAEQNTRSSGAGTKESPAWWCQRPGSMSPYFPDGRVNAQAVEIANNVGSVPDIRDFYKEIHFKANHSTDPAEQCEAIEQCYGIKMCGKSGKPVKAGEAPPVPAPNNCPSCAAPPSVGPPAVVCPSADPTCALCPNGTTKCPDGSCAATGSACPGKTCPGGMEMCPGGGCPDPVTGICASSNTPCPDGKPRSNGLCGPCPKNAPRCPDGTCPTASGSCPGSPPVVAPVPLAVVKANEPTGLPGAPVLTSKEVEKKSCGIGPKNCPKGTSFSTNAGRGTDFTKATF